MRRIIIIVEALLIQFLLMTVWSVAYGQVFTEGDIIAFDGFNGGVNNSDLDGDALEVGSFAWAKNVDTVPTTVKLLRNTTFNNVGGNNLNPSGFTDYTIDVNISNVVIACTTASSNVTNWEQLLIRWQDVDNHIKLEAQTQSDSIKFITVTSDVETIIGRIFFNWVAGVKHEMKAVVFGDSLIAYIDDSRIISVTSSYLNTNTSFGLGVSKQEEYYSFEIRGVILNTRRRGLHRTN